MASTRNKNTQENYRLEQSQLREHRDFIIYSNAANGNAYTPNLPGFGLGGARIARSNLSHNSEDIESYLRGIGSTNLEDDSFVRNFTPYHKKYATATIVDQADDLIMPVPLIVETNHRPGWMRS